MRRRSIWLSRRRLLGGPFLLITGIILMVVMPYEEYSIAILIAGVVTTLLWIVVLFRDRRRESITEPSISYQQQQSHPNYRPISQEQTSQSTTQQSEVTKFCENCGQKTEVNEKFCTNCGAPL